MALKYAAAAYTSGQTGQRRGVLSKGRRLSVDNPMQPNQQLISLPSPMVYRLVVITFVADFISIDFHLKWMMPMGEGFKINQRA
jgi:hypothetical protein